MKGGVDGGLKGGRGAKGRVGIKRGDVGFKGGGKELPGRRGFNRGMGGFMLERAISQGTGDLVGFDGETGRAMGGRGI